MRAGKVGEQHIIEERALGVPIVGMLRGTGRGSVAEDLPDQGRRLRTAGAHHRDRGSADRRRKCGNGVARERHRFTQTNAALKAKGKTCAIGPWFCRALHSRLCLFLAWVLKPSALSGWRATHSRA